MKKEQGHAGGVAVLADQETPISLLRDIKRLLSLQQATDMPADGEEYRDYQIVAGAGDLYIDTDVQFGYAYIPNCPRDITIYSGTRGGLIGSFKSGAFVQFRMPRSTGVTITYAAGGAAQTLTVCLSAREVFVGSGEILANPGTSASSLGKAEDAAHASGDVGVMALAVRNANRAVLAGTDLDYIPIGTNTQGNVFVSGTAAGISALEGVSAVTTIDDQTGNGRPLITVGMLWNGSTANIARNNNEGTALASAARTATVNSSDIVNYNGRGVWVVLDATAASATPSVVLTVEGKDALSGKYVTLFTGAAVTGISTNSYLIYPGATVTANVSVSAILPRTFRVTVTHSDADSLTYSVGYSIIL